MADIFMEVYCISPPTAKTSGGWIVMGSGPTELRQFQHVSDNMTMYSQCSNSSASLASQLDRQWYMNGSQLIPNSRMRAMRSPMPHSRRDVQATVARLPRLATILLRAHLDRLRIGNLSCMWQLVVTAHLLSKVTPNN